jgi:hypothetical protein
MLIFMVGCEAGEIVRDSGCAASDCADVDWQASELPAEFDAATAEDTIVSVLESGIVLPIDLYGWWQRHYTDLVTEGGPGCPPEMTESETSPGMGTSAWEGDCTGARYHIRGGWIATAGRTEDAGSERTRVNLLYSYVGDFVGTGAELHAGGHFIGDWGTVDDELTFDLELGGEFLDSSQPGALEGGASLGLYWEGAWSESAGLSGTFNGAVGGASGEMQFDGVTLDPTQGSGAAGVVSVRDPSSGWWTASFADDYSGCGTIAYPGVSAVESCVGSRIAAPIEALFVERFGGGD